MKYLLIIITLLINSTLAQVDLTTGELNIKVVNNSFKQVKIELNLVSPLCWDKNHQITNQFNNSILTTTGSNVWIEFLADWESTPSQYYRTFSLGLYKLTVYVNNVYKEHCYIDYRTSDLPENFNTSGSGDINLTFDVALGKLFYAGNQIEFPTFTSFWNEKPWAILITDGLPEYWSNNLVILNKGDNHPRLNWGTYPNEDLNINSYNIYRKYGSSNWILDTILSANTFFHIDNSVSLSILGGQAGTNIYYKISANYNYYNQTEFSNIVFANVQGDEIEKRGNIKSPFLNNNILLPNYPNPFNPSTKISYSIKEEGLVTLKVYDILGKEVGTLVNENKPEGNYEVQFDASQLPSGMYVYSIQSGDFKESKKCC